MRFQAILIFAAATFGSTASATTLGFEAEFLGDSLTELHTPDAEVCDAGDSSCFPVGFEVPATLRGPLSPFAGLTSGSTLEVDVDLSDDGIASCSFGGMFACPSFSEGFEQVDSNDEPIIVDVFDSLGDFNIRFDLVAESVAFFGAAGSFLPGGCSLSDPLAASLPAGYCDFFGYEAEFAIVPGSLNPIEVVPLSPSFLFALFGLAALVTTRRFQRA